MVMVAAKLASLHRCPWRPFLRRVCRYAIPKKGPIEQLKPIGSDSMPRNTQKRLWQQRPASFSNAQLSAFAVKLHWCQKLRLQTLQACGHRVVEHGLNDEAG